MRRSTVLAIAIVPLTACSLAFPTREANDDPATPGGTDASSSSSSSSSSSTGGLAEAGSDASNPVKRGAVPGGTFKRSFDGKTFNDPSNTAKVSPFELDLTEVTVARFRAFVNAFSIPKLGDGKNPRAGAEDNGWDDIASGRLAKTKAELEGRLTNEACTDGARTWLAGNDALPMNCVTWTEAFAFCIFEGARLPTEAEWNFAAAGGDEQREYPWPNAEPIDDAHAVFQGAVLAVGSKSPKGDGRWGHSDLAGNLAEWMRDGAGPYPNPCEDCGRYADASTRMVRGGSHASGTIDVRVSRRVEAGEDPQHRVATIGFRCAR